MGTNRELLKFSEEVTGLTGKRAKYPDVRNKNGFNPIPYPF